MKKFHRTHALSAAHWAAHHEKQPGTGCGAEVLRQPLMPGHSGLSVSCL